VLFLLSLVLLGLGRALLLAGHGDGVRVVLRYVVLLHLARDRGEKSDEAGRARRARSCVFCDQST
jgi:hypothetical protein